MSELFVLLLLASGTLFLAFANGANDNFKGVATLYGSRTVGYPVALGWATSTTLLGSLASLFLASKLVRAFSGNGLVPEEAAASPVFVAAVAVGASLTVLLATRLGFPISTTHALTGGLLGAGLAKVGGALNGSLLGTTFFLPLLLSPALAVVLGAGAYPLFRGLGSRSALMDRWCLCAQPTGRLSMAGSGGALAAHGGEVALGMDRSARCTLHERTRVLGRDFPSLLDAAHFASAGAVSFARGLNDAPKIVGLFVVVRSVDLRISLAAIAVAMAAGGLLFARRVAETMSRRITSMDRVQGFTANLVTSGLVLNASWIGVPVSTTHVSCGSLFGMGLVTRQADVGVVRQIVLSWILTLPLGAALAALTVVVLS